MLRDLNVPFDPCGTGVPDSRFRKGSPCGFAPDWQVIIIPPRGVSVATCKSILCPWDLWTTLSRPCAWTRQDITDSEIFNPTDLRGAVWLLSAWIDVYAHPRGRTSRITTEILDVLLCDCGYIIVIVNSWGLYLTYICCIASINVYSLASQYCNYIKRSVHSKQK